MLKTIGYEGADMADFLATLKLSKVEVLVDIRDRAQSRRRGFSKSALAAELNREGIGYVHVRQLGDPKEGREAARSGDYAHFNAVFREVMASSAGKKAIGEISILVESKSICLMCYERDPNFCHRKIVAEHLESALQIQAQHLGVKQGAGRSQIGRMRSIDQSPTASVEQVF